MKDKNSKVLYISGMTCTSCEMLIKDVIKEASEVKYVNISHKKGTAEIGHGGEQLPWKEIISKIEEAGYSASFEPIKSKKHKASFEQWLYAVLLLGGIYLVYKYLQWIGLLDWLNVDTSEINYSASFIIGIVASMSSCLVVVGAVVMSFATKYQASGTFYDRNLKPHLLFHLGRLFTFFILGGVLGLIGSWVNISQNFTSWFTIFIALVLFWLALNILGFVPSLSTLGIRMPKKSMRVWKKLQQSEHVMAPIVLGAFTFFLPCGFTQSMQLFAMSSGSFIVGGMTMFLFALGTLPVLFGLGVATTRFKNMKTVVLQKTIGFVVFFFAFYTLSSGLALQGLDINFWHSNNISQVQNTSGTQIVNMVVDYSGYTPSVFKIQKGVPVKWLIDGQQVSGCTNQIIVPSLNIKQAINPGENIIEFIPQEEGTISFSCWMGMVRGKFIVE
ncbi:sulfite exporter TauE/SafE family protein [Patescibacteria group bacterium]|nr:sulfite exporter TauE/SafE family protein [Patescibacteria group bacterium]